MSTNCENDPANCHRLYCQREGRCVLRAASEPATKPAKTTTELFTEPSSTGRGAPSELFVTVLPRDDTPEMANLRLLIGIMDAEHMRQTAGHRERLAYLIANDPRPARYVVYFDPAQGPT